MQITSTLLFLATLASAHVIQRDDGSTEITGEDILNPRNAFDVGAKLFYDTDCPEPAKFATRNHDVSSCNAADRTKDYPDFADIKSYKGTKGASDHGCITFYSDELCSQDWRSEKFKAGVCHELLHLLDYKPKCVVVSGTVSGVCPAKVPRSSFCNKKFGHYGS
ncbi:MAG: hypothetical protein M1828_000887 [Chrysothrix sp. TS-e1954]|nr:MAG: hypothetical protein M1828_000887 [Chrysothrix sp. TS-e1954]